MPLAGFIGGVAARRAARPGAARRRVRSRRTRRPSPRPAGSCWASSWRSRSTASAPAARAPRARQRRQARRLDRRRAAARDAGARRRLGVRRGRAACPGQRRPRSARGRAALVDPGRAERRVPAIGTAPEHAAADRPESGRPRARRRTWHRRPRHRSGRSGSRAAAASVLRVRGSACGLGVEGSGWIAAPELVVTNAHVVAGQDDTTVTTTVGDELDVDVLHYEPRNDLAVLGVPGLAARHCPLVGDPQRDTAGGDGRLSRGRAAHVHARAPRADGHRDQRGLVRARARRAADDPVPRRRAKRQLGRPGRRRGRPRDRPPSSRPRSTTGRRAASASQRGRRPRSLAGSARRGGHRPPCAA